MDLLAPLLAGLFHFQVANGAPSWGQGPALIKAGSNLSRSWRSSCCLPRVVAIKVHSVFAPGPVVTVNVPYGRNNCPNSQTLMGAGCGKGRTVFYSAVGPELTLYNMNVDDATLTKRNTVTLPGNVQYAWPHPSRQYFYVVSSGGGPGVASDKNFANAFRIDPASGILSPHGEPVVLPSRPIHTSVDMAGEFLLTAYNEPSSLRSIASTEAERWGIGSNSPTDLIRPRCTIKFAQRPIISTYFWSHAATMRPETTP